MFSILRNRLLWVRNRDIAGSMAGLAREHDLAVVLNRRRGDEGDVRAAKAGGTRPLLPNVGSTYPLLKDRANVFEYVLALASG